MFSVRTSFRTKLLFGTVLLNVSFYLVLLKYALISGYNDNTNRRHDELLDEPSFLDPFKDNVTTVRAARLTSLNDTTITTGERSSSREVLIPYFSSVDYFACCGAGHRLTKLADAYYVAKLVQFSIRVFFGFCTDPDQEIFSYFFGPQPYDEAKAMAKNSTPNLALQFSNEVPGFTRLIREGPNTTCRCTNDRLESDVELFHGLRNRFRARHKVDIFRTRFFTNYTVIGMHVRAGNGETGDFQRKNRTISDIYKWQNAVVDLLISISTNWTHARPPLLFVATDTETIATSFRTLLADTMPVVDLSQNRMDHGEGVLFGEGGKVASKGRECLDGWESAFTDMMILSHADVVLAARPSSFTQSIPMTLALSTDKSQRQVLKSYCEVNPAATKYVCYEDLIDWCCNGVTSFSLEGIQRWDYRRMPRTGIDEKVYEHRMQRRPRRRDECMPTPASGGRVGCLPYQFPIAEELESALIGD